MGKPIEAEDMEQLERRFNVRMDAIEKIQRENSVAIAALTVNIQKLTDSTQGMVDVWSAGRTLQSAIKWLSGFSAIAIIIAWFAGLK